MSDVSTTDSVEIALWLSNSLRKIPPISPMVAKLARLQLDEDDAGTVLAQVIQSDPGLCAKIIGLANSAFYNASGRASYTVQDALMRLGLQPAWQVSLSFVMGSSIAIDPELKRARADLWSHSYLVGVCTKEVATASDVPTCDSTIGFLAGFLHDIGFLAMLALEPNLARRMIADMRNPDIGYTRGFEHRYGLPTHGIVGKELCRLWGMPEEIGNLIELHVLDDPFEAPDEEQPVLMAVQLGHHLAEELAPDEEITRSVTPLPVEDVLSYLGIAPAKYSKLVDRLGSRIDALKHVGTSI